MTTSIPSSPTGPSSPRLGGRPLRTTFHPIPLVCLSLALATDVAYSRTATMLWANMSAWLLLVGVIGLVFAVIAGAVDLFGDRRLRGSRTAWAPVIGDVIALPLAIVNSLVHSRDAYTSVVPEGLILSASVVVVLLVTGWTGRTGYQGRNARYGEPV